MLKTNNDDNNNNNNNKPPTQKFKWAALAALGYQVFLKITK